MNLGDKVSFIRHDENYQVQSGEGLIAAIITDLIGRPMVSVETGSGRVNVYVPCLNADETFKAAFIEYGHHIVETAEKANSEIKRLTDEANKHIDQLHTSVLGEPLIFQFDNETADQSNAITHETGDGVEAIQPPIGEAGQASAETFEETTPQETAA